MLPAYLALGDSYTIGEGVPAEARWPVQLARQLRAHGIALGDPQVIAVTGWTTDELASGMGEATLAPPYALVSLQIGVNNQYRGLPVDAYRDQFSALLTRAIGLAGERAQRVLVVSIPDWGVTRFAREQNRDGATIARELDLHNALAREMAEHRGVRFVDITAISRSHPQLLADDGLHPSAAQYGHWVAAIVPAAAQALQGTA